MPDLSKLPPNLIAPFAVVFALALFVAKIFDIIERWKRLRTPIGADGNKHQDSVQNPEKGDIRTEFSTKKVFLLSFLGACLIPVFSTLLQFAFINDPNFRNAQLENLLSILFFSLLSAIVCSFFIKNKFPLIKHNQIVTITIGFTTSAILSTPVGVIVTIVSINKHFG